MIPKFNWQINLKHFFFFFFLLPIEDYELDGVIQLIEQDRVIKPNWIVFFGIWLNDLFMSKNLIKCMARISTFKLFNGLKIFYFSAGN